MHPWRGPKAEVQPACAWTDSTCGWGRGPGIACDRDGIFKHVPRLLPPQFLGRSWTRSCPSAGRPTASSSPVSSGSRAAAGLRRAKRGCPGTQAPALQVERAQEDGLAWSGHWVWERESSSGPPHCPGNLRNVPAGCAQGPKPPPGCGAAGAGARELCSSDCISHGGCRSQTKRPQEEAAPDDRGPGK